MDRRDIKILYHQWLYDKVMLSPRYTSLLKELDRHDYIWHLPMDANRYEQGVALRYRFGAECGIDDQEIASLIDIRPCSILEMLVALVLCISERILDDGDWETKKIFMTILNNLGLSEYTDYSFTVESVDEVWAILDSFSEGKLYLFPTNGEDMSNVDLWYQAHRYLLKEGDL